MASRVEAKKQKQGASQAASRRQPRSYKRQAARTGVHTSTVPVLSLACTVLVPYADLPVVDCADRQKRRLGCAYIPVPRYRYYRTNHCRCTGKANVLVQFVFTLAVKSSRTVRCSTYSCARRESEYGYTSFSQYSLSVCTVHFAATVQACTTRRRPAEKMPCLRGAARTW